MFRAGPRAEAGSLVHRPPFLTGERGTRRLRARTHQSREIKGAGMRRPPHEAAYEIFTSPGGTHVRRFSLGKTNRDERRAGASRRRFERGRDYELAEGVALVLSGTAIALQFSRSALASFFCGAVARA